MTNRHLLTRMGYPKIRRPLVCSMVFVAGGHRVGGVPLLAFRAGRTSATASLRMRDAVCELLGGPGAVPTVASDSHRAYYWSSERPGLQRASILIPLRM